MNKYLEKIAQISKEAKIEINPANKGKLHAEMGVKKDKPISTSALESEKSKAERTGNTKLEKRVTFALNARKWNHK